MTTENTGLKLEPSATESRYFNVTQKSGACWPVSGPRDIEASRHVRDEERRLAALALEPPPWRR